MVISGILRARRLFVAIALLQGAFAGLAPGESIASPNPPDPLSLAPETDRPSSKLGGCLFFGGLALVPTGIYSSTTCSHGCPRSYGAGIVVGGAAMVSGLVVSVVQSRRSPTRPSPESTSSTASP